MKKVNWIIDGGEVKTFNSLRELKKYIKKHGWVICRSQYYDERYYNVFHRITGQIYEKYCKGKEGQIVNLESLIKEK